MTAFAAAIDVLFSDPNLGLDAVYRIGGADPGVLVRVIIRQPDRVGEYGDTRLLAKTTVFDVRVSEVAAPAEGDTMEVSGTVYAIQDGPMRDAERLVWTIEARPT
ncbi:MAG: hypothetical protein HWD60_00595 [Defluviicoccus sp.]|nr:MAG: hypothetical protein HWD60_00595 [Defluviicoccus sp.]